VTHSKQNVSSRIGRPAEEGPRAFIDPNMRCIGLHLYDGTLKIIPLSKDTGLPNHSSSFDVQLDELQVIDLKFLYLYPTNPTLCVLYRNDSDHRHVRTYNILINEKLIKEGKWSLPNMDPTTMALISVPKGGVLMVSEKSICYQSHSGLISERRSVSTATRSMIVRCFTRIDSDGSRYLICDNNGILHILVLENKKNNVEDGDGNGDGNGNNDDDEDDTKGTSSNSSSSSSSTSVSVSSTSSVSVLRLERMGETSCASSISYLDNGIVYVGSSLGDSQLIRLTSTPVVDDEDEEDEHENETSNETSSSSSAVSSSDISLATPGEEESNNNNNSSSSSSSSTEQPTFIKPIEEYQNIGPILDFTVVDTERQGQGHIVTCSGAYKDGSLRIIRNGIGIDEDASLDMEGIKGMWSLRKQFNNTYDEYLVVTFRSETHVLGIDGETMSEVDIPGFDDTGKF